MFRYVNASSRYLPRYDRIARVHMFGPFGRSQMNAGQDGFSALRFARMEHFDEDIAITLLTRRSLYFPVSRSWLE
jgi:hypothetical protein